MTDIYNEAYEAPTVLDTVDTAVDSGFELDIDPWEDDTEEDIPADLFSFPSRTVEAALKQLTDIIDLINNNEELSTARDLGIELWEDETVIDPILSGVPVGETVDGNDRSGS